MKKLRFFFENLRDAKQILKASTKELRHTQNTYRSECKKLKDAGELVRAAKFAGKVEMIDEILEIAKYGG
jgi:hypothetical protein